MKSSSTLAINGGKPIREEPYPIHTTILDDAEEKQLIDVIRDGHLSGFSARPGERFLGGTKVKELESLFQEKFKIKFAVSSNSATSSIHSAISALGIGAGDEVITSPFTMSATGSSVVMQNAVPVFADIEDRTFGLDPKSVESLITSRTKAILTVNILGHPSRLSDLKEIARKNNLFLIEDNAQSPLAIHNGQMTGTIGDIGILSLNYHKCIQTGEGGIALTACDGLAENLRLVRNHGEVIVGKIDKDQNKNQLGWNYRLSELQAAVGIPQIDKIEMLTEIRTNLASLLTNELSNFDFLSPPIVEEDSTHVYYLYGMKFLQGSVPFSRDDFVKAMNAEGIALNSGYVQPMYLEPMYQYPDLTPQLKTAIQNASNIPNYSKGICPTAERIHSDEICITDICKYPNNEDEVYQFIEAVDKVSKGLS